MGLVATMAALVLGLLVSSAKTFYDSQSTEMTEMSTKVILLDRMLARYGPQAKEIHDVLRGTIADSINRIWPQERTGPSRLFAPTTDPDVHCQNSGTVAEGREPPRPPGPSLEYWDWSHSNPLVDV